MRRSLLLRRKQVSLKIRILTSTKERIEWILGQLANSAMKINPLPFQERKIDYKDLNLEGSPSITAYHPITLRIIYPTVYTWPQSMLQKDQNPNET